MIRVLVLWLSQSRDGLKKISLIFSLLCIGPVFHSKNVERSYLEIEISLFRERYLCARYTFINVMSGHCRDQCGEELFRQATSWDVCIHTVKWLCTVCHGSQTTQSSSIIEWLLQRGAPSVSGCLKWDHGWESLIHWDNPDRNSENQSVKPVIRLRYGW